MVTEITQYPARLCFAANWQNYEILLILNHLQFILLIFTFRCFCLNCAEEIAFLRYIAGNSTPQHYRDYVLCNYLRVKDACGEYRWVKHRMIPLATDKNGCLLLCACIYTLATDEDRKAKFANTRTGEVRILTNKDYENILSIREMEVLRLIDQGLLSKEISDNLCISINTVNRHRQNILQKLKVDRAIEACKLAHVMGLL